MRSDTADPQDPSQVIKKTKTNRLKEKIEKL
jgi:hypothetical protein